MRSDDEAKWSELEQAFFDAAPADEPCTPPAPLDDSPLIAAPAPHDRMAELRLRSLTALAAARASLQQLVHRLRAAPWFTALRAPRLTRRAVAIGLASATLLIGLSAGVVAALSGGSNAPVAPPAAVPAVASVDVAPASDVVHPRASATLMPHTRAAKHPRVRTSAAKHAQHKHRKLATGHSTR